MACKPPVALGIGQGFAQIGHGGFAFVDGKVVAELRVNHRRIGKGGVAGIDCSADILPVVCQVDGRGGVAHRGAPFGARGAGFAEDGRYTGNFCRGNRVYNQRSGGLGGFLGLLLLGLLLHLLL